MNRKCEVALTIFLMVLTAPILIAVLLITWLELRCNVVFSDSRVGKNDPRVTRFSRFVRRYSLDELPQFFNVIKNEMSLIGPRPELPKGVEHWAQQLPLYKERLTILPGISGWAQVNGYRKGYIEPEKRLSYDFVYVRQRNFWFYMKIFAMTPWAIIKYDVW